MSTHTTLWRRAAHGLGRLWAKMIALPDPHTEAARRDQVPRDYYNFPPF